MVHVMEHLSQRLRASGHLHAKIEALFHTKIGHHIVKGLSPDIDRPFYPQRMSQVQPVGVDVGDHHMAGTDPLCDGGGHEPDRPSTGDDHVFANNWKAQCRVGGVPERVKNRGSVIADFVWDDKDVAGGNDDVVRESTGPTDSYTHR